MVEVILHGCNGRMGQMLSGLIAEDEEMRLRMTILYTRALMN